MYAGFLMSYHIASLNEALKKTHRWKICEKTHSIEELIARADKKFFQKSQFSGHYIQQLLPALRELTLKQRAFQFKSIIISVALPYRKSITGGLGSALVKLKHVDSRYLNMFQELQKLL